LDKILLGGSALVGLALFLGLSKSHVSSNFMSEVVAELAKVTWPELDETMKATIAVLIAVTIAGVIFWMVDNVWIYLIGLVL
ncbi:MAG: preprotein translocase subunit SecE, partial [Bdellovibrionota bacterium]